MKRILATSLTTIALSIFLVSSNAGTGRSQGRLANHQLRHHGKRSAGRANLERRRNTECH